MAISHFPARRDEALELQVRRAVQQALAEHPGDLLVFLPGQREIARVQAGLQESLNGDVEVWRCTVNCPWNNRRAYFRWPAMAAGAWCWRPTSPSRR